MKKQDDTESSNDEEAFNDYFQNPQKRKQFDNVRLYQQQKELSKMSGYNKQFSLEYPKKLKDNQQQKNYATVSLCCLTVTNPFRDKIIRLVLNPWFDRFILLVIIANCVFLAIDDPLVEQLMYQKVSDYVFLAIFTIEMILKIIAMGFAFRPHSYLRDTWNILDFAVVIVGWVGKFVQQKNISAIRVIRILRPLRTVNSMPGMRKLVQSLLNSLPTLFDILILFIFFLIMFGTIGNQLFEGILVNRCINEQGEMQMYEDGYEYMCNKDSQCDTDNGYKCVYYGNPNEGITSFDNIFLAVLNIFIIITLEGWTDTMYLVRKATGSLGYDVYFVVTVIFGTFFVLNLMIAVQFTYLNASFDEDRQRRKELEEELAIQKQQQMDTPIQSQENDEKSDNVSQANDFGEAVSKYKKKETNRSENLATNMLLNAGDNSFVNDHNNGIQSEEGEQETPKSKREESKEDPQEEVIEEFKDNQDSTKNKNKKEKGKSRKCETIGRLSDYVEVLIETRWFNGFVIFLIIFNSILLALEYDHMPIRMARVINLGNQIFTITFAVEMVLKIFGLGIKKYVMDGFNIFDAIIVIVGLLDFFHLGSRALTVLRAFRLLRIFKIVRRWTSLRKLLQTVFQSLGSISNLALLMFLLIFIYALIGMQFLGGKIMLDGERFRYNFNTFGYSLITVFILITGENWDFILQGFIIQDGFIVTIYFITLIVLGNMMLLNLFLAILLNYISDNLDDQDQQELEQEHQLEQPSEKLNEQKPIKSFNSLNASQGQGNGTPASIKNSSNIKVEDIKVNLNREANPNQISEKSQEDMSNSEIQTVKHKISSNIQEFEVPYKTERRIQELLNLQNEENKEESQKKINMLSNFKSSVVKSSANQTMSRSGRRAKQNKSIELHGKSLFLFPANQKFRILLKDCLEHPYFEGFIYHLIGLNSLILALDQPDTVDPYEKNTLKTLQQIISAVFVIEAVAKIIAQGFIIGRSTYLKDPWNILDFIIVLTTILNWALTYAPTDFSITFIRGFRALRALRPLRMVSKNEGMKNVVNSLLKSIPNLLNVLLICLLFYFVFGVLGVQLFKGAMGYCTDSTISYRYDCIGDYFNTESEQYEQREWLIYPLNFDNVFYSMLTFFSISTVENWPETLFQAIDSVGDDLGPKLDNRPQMAVVFIIFIFITTFFVINLFISVIVDKFNEEIRKKDGSHSFTEEQKEWVKMQRIMMSVKVRVVPVVPTNKLRRLCFRLVQSAKFEYFLIFIILFNTLLLCMDYYNAPAVYSNVINNFNIFFVIVFTIECTLKLLAYGFYYFWHENWNKMDVLIVILSLITLDPKLFNFNVTALRIIRVARLLKMIKASRGLRHLLKTLYLSLENILNVGMLLSLVFFTFSVAGMDLFGNVPFGENITMEANFRTFYKAFLTLIRCSTGENWNVIMGECWQSAGPIAIFYWVVFYLIANFIFLNVFVAVICENFNDIKQSEDVNEVLSLKRKDIKAFIGTWAYFNPRGDLYMKTSLFPAFLMELPPPLGYEGIKIEQSKLNKIIFCLNIKDHQGKVYFPEVMWAIFHSIVGNNDEKVHKCEQVIQIMKMLKRKYKGLGKNVTPDTLCGNKFYKNEMTVSKYLCAMQIVNTWRKFKEQRKKLKEEETKKLKRAGSALPFQLDNDNTFIKEDESKIKEESKEESEQVSRSQQQQDQREDSVSDSSDSDKTYNIYQDKVSSESRNKESIHINSPIANQKSTFSKSKTLEYPNKTKRPTVQLKRRRSSIISEEIKESDNSNESFSEDKSEGNGRQISSEVKQFNFSQLKGEVKQSRPTEEEELLDDTPRLITQNDIKGVRQFNKSKTMKKFPNSKIQ